MTGMTTITTFDHVGVTVSDLEAATAFFVSLGLEVEGRTSVEGEFIDTVSGVPDSRTDIVMLRPPGGGTGLELARFVHPDMQHGSPDRITEVGLRNVCFVVDGLREIVDRLAADGFGLVGGIGEWQDTWLMAYVRGPESIVVSLTERIG
jgi:catechol 2,3-dioxygenase-like lactoylglutathione lyase family enzyme